MGRTREFDRDQAIKAAMAVFWNRGFEATTTDDLLAAMGIGRQSLYDTFGDKRQLYLEALNSYSVANVTALNEIFRKASSPMSALRNILLSMAAETPEVRLRGCMGVNSISEFGVQDPDVAAITKMSGLLLRSTLERVLNDAKAAGELDPSLDERKAAKFLHATMLGIRVRARAGDSPEDLRDMATFAIDSLLRK
jgi:TetR/AcrR family transcriptional regulator, transcriptional repressor for nem operon